MKFQVFTIVILLCLVPCLVHGDERSESSFDIKAGISYPNIGTNNPDRPALDSAFSFNLGLDKYFALGLETGLNWVQWDMHHPGTYSDYDKKTSNALTIPIMLSARIRFDLRNKLYIMPYITAGAGYSLSFLLCPGKDLIYGGFTWHGMCGTAIRPVKTSFTEILIEAGFRGISMTSREDHRLDMSGFVARAGVRFCLGILDRLE